MTNDERLYWVLLFLVYTVLFYTQTGNLPASEILAVMAFGSHWTVFGEPIMRPIKDGDFIPRPRQGWENGK